jgi:mRNA-degrading endonuclease HigB of HigAB toxin-antitoxin module
VSSFDGTNNFVETLCSSERAWIGIRRYDYRSSSAGCSGLRDVCERQTRRRRRGAVGLRNATLERSTWRTMVDVKDTFSATDHIAGERVCFDIGGNKWRIIANVAYKHEIVFIVWIGIHAEYEKL